MNLPQFLSQLGSSKGAPGGGAAAALAGAAGAALVEMTARLNDKRLKSNSGSASKAAALRVKLHGLIAKDAAAFARVQKAYCFRKINQPLWQSAVKNAAQPPLLIAEACAAASALAKREKNRTSEWLESDRREALILLRAAFESAKLNADINLKEMKDRAFIRRAHKGLRKWRLSL